MASPGPAGNTNQLQITDLAELLQLLSRHGYSGASYYNLGLFLGLSTATLDVIKENNKGDVVSCLRECLTKWLQKADDVQKKGGPTIYSLVSALRELGENGVADGIDMEKHPACRILACYTSNQSLLSALPQLTELLCSEKLIKEVMLIATVEGKDLLIQIKETVCNDYRKLETFAEILREVTTTVGIGNAIKKDYRELYCSNDLPEMDESSAKYPKFYLPLKMATKFMSMRVKFSNTFKKVGVIIKEKPIPTFEDVRSTLRFFCRPLRPQLAVCQDIDDILELISDNSSLIDISLLESLVDELNIDEAKEVLLEYNDKAAKELNKKDLTQCLGEIFSSISLLQCETITILVDKSHAKFILDDVRICLKNLFENSSPLVRLNVIKEDNSFTITCSFPLTIFKQLIRAALNNIDVLKENKVKRLTIGYCTVYEVKDTSTATTTEIDEYISSLSTSSGLMKQLMLSLSVQLINSKEEVNTLTEKNMEIKKEVESMKKEAESSKKEVKSLKETLDTKNKMLTAIIEPRIGKKIDLMTRQDRGYNEATLDKNYGQLTIADLAYIDNLLHMTRHDFTTANVYKLGLQLGLSADTLDFIHRKWNKDATHCLRECLKEWLKQADDVRSKGGATIPALIKALRKIGETAIADGICNECHPACCIFKRHISDQSMSDTILQLALNHVERELGIMDPLTGGAKVQLSLIQDFVCTHYQNLDKFATVLQQFPSTEAIGAIIRKKYSKQQSV
ncbi:PREDICTED: uncharacterized protein LOC109586046 [Amphimedon queenslandica]|uniref:Death domain-containing protein n=1 Tax=Amphimedon queenslandica TaxID=400682 RepID=A0AAN0JL92_AMPQE|nr:PREDICTED: uncharacterized protein LOC109586046 [Amphimedon queenslandica]|eukprot:XP_019857773.1 PREDICTED: uncharacterized protein LOC109586046 [Amphimedon queenslandica]